ncbi:MAG TPA: hypothetical protein P5123_11130, partial [Spirochaetota bacterium]|nr:hypothetical protein [Spirochaetota bacterium]
MYKKTLFVFLLFLWSSLYANQSKYDPTIILSSGFGARYGASSLGVGTDYYPLNYSNHHLGLICGIGYRYDLFMWTIGSRYAYGNRDRIIVDILYGVMDYDVEMHEDGSYHNAKSFTNPSLLIGYQRLT